MTSVATFVINPGLVHAYGWAGVMGYGVAGPLGTSWSDRDEPELPHCRGEDHRPDHSPVDRRTLPGPRLTVSAAVSLLQITFLVLIVTGWCWS